MKEGWEYKKIKDIGSVIAGTTPNTNVAEYWDGNLCWISPAELDGSHYLYDSRKKITAAAVKAKSLKLLPEGTVILSSRAPIGKVVINKVPTYCNQGFKCVVCGKEVYNEFLYWWFWGKTDYLNSLGTGATFKEISKKVVEEITIPVPPLSEQQSIVDYLDSAFAKIDAMKANAEKALNEAKALFQASLKEMLEPKEGWEYEKLGEVCDFEGGSQPPKSEWINHPQNGYVRMLQIRDFTKSRNAEIEYVKITKKLRLCKDDDILIGRYGASVGKILTGLAGAYNVAIIKSIPNEELIRKDFIRRYFESSLFQSILFKVCTSRAAQAGFSKDDIKDELIPVPPLSEQQSIVATLDSLKSKVDRLQENYDKISQECDALKQAILRQVFE